MPTIAEAALSEEEGRVLKRFVELVQAALGDELHAVWLYGSRARGERPHPESDIDLLVLTQGGLSRDFRRVWSLLFKAAEDEDGNPGLFSIQVFDPEWLAGRRAIGSFYIQEVDRDKIVLAGEP